MQGHSTALRCTPMSKLDGNPAVPVEMTCVCVEDKGAGFVEMILLFLPIGTWSSSIDRLCGGMYGCCNVTAYYG